MVVVPRVFAWKDDSATAAREPLKRHGWAPIGWFAGMSRDPRHMMGARGPVVARIGGRDSWLARRLAHRAERGVRNEGERALFSVEGYEWQ